MCAVTLNETPAGAFQGEATRALEPPDPAKKLSPDGSPASHRLYQDRRAAGRELARRLRNYAHLPNALVLALPRGGVPVGFEIASQLGLPLDIYLVRKLGVPAQPELAMGAIASGGVQVLNEEVIRKLKISPQTIEDQARIEQVELERREREYRGARPPFPVAGRTVILVDDGLATGASMRAAVLAMKELKPARIIVAVPTAAPETCASLRREVDELVCGVTPEFFEAVGQSYLDFTQTTDQEVRELLRLVFASG